MFCNNCETNTCNISLKEIQNFVYNIENKISELSINRINNYYDSNYCEDNISELILYKFLLEKYIKDSLRGSECTCIENIEKLISKLFKYIPKVQDIDSNVNREAEILWIKNNVQCTSKAKWKKLAYKICHEINIDISLIPIDTLCDLAVDIHLETLSCDVIEAVSVSSVSCKNNVEVNRTDKECKLDYKILLENVKDAPSFNTYMKAVRQHHMTFDQILDIYKSGAKLEEGSNGCMLTTQLRSYPLSELSFKGYFESEKVDNGLIKPKPSNIKKYTQDYKQTQC